MFARFQDYTAYVRPRLEDAFRAQLSELLRDVTLKDGAALHSALADGKKIRGSLLCLVGNALGAELETVLPRAVAVEFIQAASLIHDDFVDQDTIRRNQPATWTLEGARQAVLIGDVIFASAIKMMSDLGREDGAVVSHAIAQVARGAVHEPLSPLMLARAIESNRVDGGLYAKIIHLKTGILFGAACRLGAVAARAAPDLRDRFCRYGLRIGEAYQIADDIHEMQQHIRRPFIDADRMALLTPACIYFANQMVPRILPILKGDGPDDGLVAGFQTAVRAMRAAIEDRLALALAEIADGCPQNGYSALARRAPWDLIRMFKA